MRNVLITKIVLNDDGWELSKEHQSTSNEWTKTEIDYIRTLLNSGKDYIDGNHLKDGIETAYFIQK